MTDFLIWRDAWSIGIDDIDADHREMVRLINRLADPQDQRPILQRFDALTRHMRAHFAREERFLERIGYPDLTNHANAHIMEMAELTLLRKDLEASGAGVVEDADLQAIKTWFFNHAIAEDRKFSEYFRSPLRRH